MGSVTVGVVRGSADLWTRSYGYRDPERRLPADRDTVYRIASLTKPFTALLLLRLAEERKLSLEDPVTRYCDDARSIRNPFDGDVRPTLRQLATMTSGLDKEPPFPDIPIEGFQDLPDWFVGPVSEWEDDLRRALPLVSYVAEPGERFLYSNIGYALLGEALGKAGGAPYTDLVRKEILEPLGMRDTVFELTPSTRERLAHGETDEHPPWTTSTGVPEFFHGGRGYRVPNGGLYSTVADLSRFVAFHLGHGPEEILGEEARDRIHEELDLGDDPSWAYGLGLMAFEEDGRLILGHDGDLLGYEAAVFFSLPQDVGVIVLRSASGGSFDVSGTTKRWLRRFARRLEDP